MTRDAAEPWVQDSSVTWPWVFSWILSSPTAPAAAIASEMSCSLSSLMIGSPPSSSVEAAARVHIPA